MCDVCSMKRHIALSVPFAVPPGAEVEVTVSCGGKIFIQTTLEVSPFGYAIRGMHFNAVPHEILVADPSRADDSITTPRNHGDHYFENICNACGSAQPDGSCEICPHIGPAAVCKAEHFARRPCRSCGSADLRTVRVRPARTP